MYTSIKTSIFVILLFLNKPLSQNENDLNKENLKGYVKSLRETSYSVKEINGSIVKKRITLNYYLSMLEDGNSLDMSRLLIFDEKGNLTEYNVLNESGEAESKIIYQYDEYSGLREKEYVKKLKDNNLVGVRPVYEVESRIVYKHDDNGMLIKKTSTGFASKYSHIYSYDESNNIIEDKTYGEYEQETNPEIKPSLQSRKTFKYDNKKRLTEKVEYGRNNLFLSKFKYSYIGRQIHRTEYDSSDNVGRKRVCEYDVYGNIIKLNEFVINGDLVDNRRLVFTYDKQNNWIKALYYDDDKLEAIIERDIVYYK